MIEIDGVKYLTEAQWNKKHRAVLKRQRDKGIWKSWYIDQKHETGAYFYCESQTRAYNQKELKAAKRKQSMLEKTRKERLSCKCCGEYYGRYAQRELTHGLCRFCGEAHTAWQWLAYKHMAPKKGEDPQGYRPEYWDPENECWAQSAKIWYYYNHSQVRPISEKRFEDLKKKYIKRFGGWEKIDLDHTDYDGKIWW